MDELPPDLSTELGSPKGYLLDKPGGGNDQHQEEPGAFGYPSERASSEGECRGTGGVRQYDGRGRNQGEHGGPTLGYRNPRSRRSGTGGGRSGQKFKSLATLWEATQEGEDQREEGRCMNAGGKTAFCFDCGLDGETLKHANQKLNGTGEYDYGTDVGDVQCYYHKNSMDIAEYVNKPCVDDMVNLAFDIAEIAEKCDYQHGYNIKRYVYLDVYDLMIEEYEVKWDYHRDYHTGKFFGLTLITANEFNETDESTKANGDDPDFAPVLSRLQWDPYSLEEIYSESTLVDFNYTRSMNTTGNFFENTLYNTQHPQCEMGKILAAVVVIGTFLLSIPLVMTWMLVPCNCWVAPTVGVEGYEHWGSDIHRTDFLRNIFLGLFLGYLLLVRVQFETEAYSMAMIVVSNFCLDLATWCMNNICPLLVIGIVMATLGLVGCQIGKCLDRRSTVEHRCVLVCGERKATRRRFRCTSVGILKPIVWYLLVWNQVGVLAGTALLNCYGTYHEGQPNEDDLTETSCYNTFGAHGEHEGWDDDMAIFQTQWQMPCFMGSWQRSTRP